MSDQASDISVIICAYTEERWSELLKAVKSIQQQNTPVREIVLVIDHNPRLLERIRPEVPGVIVIENSGARGLSGARNSGITQACGAWIAFLDDDAIAEPDWIERLYACCQKSDILGAGGFVEPLWVEKKPAWFPHEFYWIVGCSYQEQLPTVVEVRNPYGGCMCIQREVFETVGGFREGIGRVGNRPLGGEETELSIRAKQRWPEKHFLFDPQARIHHHVTPGRASWSYFFSRCYSEGISKAAITRLVGTGDSLASERSYTFRTLPKGVLRGLRDGIFKHDLSGFLRASAIVAGLSVTTVGYLVGKFSHISSIQEDVKTSVILQKSEATVVE